MMKPISALSKMAFISSTIYLQIMKYRSDYRQQALALLATFPPVLRPRAQHAG